MGLINIQLLLELPSGAGILHQMDLKQTEADVLSCWKSHFTSNKTVCTEKQTLLQEFEAVRKRRLQDAFKVLKRNQNQYICTTQKMNF